MALGLSKAPIFSNHITGTWGKFRTSSGEIHYLETKAQLWADQESSQETKLTDHLVPVRELIDPKLMDFNQLLQRDLDDHRVATELVPYLLKKREIGAAFFPPIVATFLPFNGTHPKESFDEYSEVKPHTDDIITWSGYRFGNCLQFEQAKNPDGLSNYEVRIGRLQWNTENAKLVVIDGQHRAMAMLAINRTLNNSWSGEGEKYKFFYEEEIRQIMNNQPSLLDMSGVEFPVTLVWFHSLDKNFDHHKAARRLFVDVNKNAKAPSESRILLLEDSKLTARVTREVLNLFRNTNDGLPIYAIEYDHPGKDQTRFNKWSVISNIGILEDSVKRTLFGPKKYIDDVTQRIGGREGQEDMASFFRKTLGLDDLIPTKVPEDGFRIEHLSDSVYPESYSDALLQRAMLSWGGFIVSVLSRLEPYRMHGEALRHLGNEWREYPTRSALAKNAIFDGVGMYWTIKDSHSTWREKAELRGKAGSLKKTAIVHAWEELEHQKEKFLDLRASLYGNTSKEKELKLIKESYEIFSTNACQVGLFLAARSIAFKNQIDYTEVRAFGEYFIRALNSALVAGPGSIGRRALFSRSARFPVMNITRLDTPMAVYFRYYWLELITTDEARAVLDGFLDMIEVDKITARARQSYFKFRVQEQLKALQRVDASSDASVLEKKAHDLELKDLKKMVHHWFGKKLDDRLLIDGDNNSEEENVDVREDEDVNQYEDDLDSDNGPEDEDYWNALQDEDE